MATKQVQKSETIRASVIDTSEAPAVVQQPNPNNNSGERRSVYMTVKTFTADKQIGFRVVDLMHYGTSRWLQKHTWWAMLNGHDVEQSRSTAEEIGAYLFEQEKALQAKYNTQREVVAA